jgi:RHS repeat-associated protein
MELPGRTYTSTNQYRYGYQGSEKDKELNTNTYTTFFREIDTRIGRWWSVDTKSSSFESPYVIIRNNPIWFNDIRGDSIPAKFYNSDGQATNEIPSVVQNQYQQEYGITLGYECR